MKGIQPAKGDGDWMQHFNEMTFRLIHGQSLMAKVIEDADVALTLLSNLPEVRSSCVGVLGHSMGGNTALFQSALDDRVVFACAS